MLYCEAELCLAASTFARGGILSENFKDGKVTVHSAKNTTKFDAIVGRSANHADQLNLGVAAALRSNIYGGTEECHAPHLLPQRCLCGMEIHIKKPTDKKAKTVAMLAALPPAVYDGLWSEVGGAATHGGADLSDINVTINDIANCTIPVVDKAKYQKLINEDGVK